VRSRAAAFTAAALVSVGLFAAVYVAQTAVVHASSGRVLAPVGVYGFLACGATAAYLALVGATRALDWRDGSQRRMALVALFVPLVGALLLIPTQPRASDISTRIWPKAGSTPGSGRTPSGRIPMAPSALSSGGSFSPKVGSRVSLRRPTGPCGRTRSLVASSGLSARADAVLMKMVAVGAAALGGVFVWSILGEVVPSAQLVGTVAYGWTPC
jgi:hypothetical protein